MIIDSHCHLNYEPMFTSLDETIERARREGVEYMLTISTEDKSFQSIIKIIDNYEKIYGTYGIHPHEAKNHQGITCDEIINKTKKNSKIIGIGETGLDFFYNHSEEKHQINSFLEHIKASQLTNLPIIVHTRSAEDKTYEILKESIKYKDFKILIHCFTGSKEFAFKLLDLGAYISASGVVTFKKSNLLAETFKLIPNNKILVETDAPYLSPEPLRGKSNEPSHIKHTVQFLSKIKNIDFKEFSEITSANFFKLFGNLN